VRRAHYSRANPVERGGDQAVDGEELSGSGTRDTISLNPRDATNHATGNCPVL
jgi:hypothetical protein